ncbi:MAG: sigma-70 family RNA polymerase sigma factor [Verrucomicrobia bacterium]|jgi:RNA polymerase primary sigma factor|nr:sigma-70 family RNA polymerase sigma factor [Verrucomicrobiota bacterium]
MNLVDKDLPKEEISVGRNADTASPEVQDVRDLPSTDRTTIKLYLQEIGKTPLLKPSEEVELAALIQQGDARAREKMIRANLRLVVKIAHDYANFGLPLLDLISEGNIGLIKAVERFDPAKGGKLSTYAAWWIKQSIKRALANQSKTIRLPVHLVDKIARMRRISAELEEELDREPTNEEIAAVMEMPVNKIAHLKSVSVRPASLDAPVGDDEGTEFGSLIGDENSIDPVDSLQSKNVLDDLNQLIDELDAREAEIIRLRFGLGGGKARTLEEVGEQFGVTRERVRQLQNMALTRMRKALLSKERQRSQEEIDEEHREAKRMEVLQEFYQENIEAKSIPN